MRRDDWYTVGGPMVEFDPGLVEITRWVIHEIPKTFRKHEGVEPTLSEAVSPHDEEVARFFERKISDSFGRSKHQVQPDGTNETPGSVLTCLGGEEDLMALSIRLGKQLFESQSGAMSGGLLVVMEGKHDGSPILSVLKLEKEEGARAASAQVEGKSTYSVEYMRDLFLTGRTRVFKVAVFAQDTDETLVGWVSDPQSKGTDIADFFLSTFLGCQLTNDPEVTTQRFHDAAEKFINEQVTDPEKKARYETAVIAELNRNDAEVKLKAFVKDNLDVDDRKRFVDAMQASGVNESFIKDVKLIKTRLRRLQHEFEAGVKVSYPVDMPDGVVSVKGRTDGRTQLQVIDNLKILRSRGA